jgi:hypothetical protein
VTLTAKLRTAALVACGGWALALLFWRPAPFSITFDDAFYYFTIGRNLAHGYGSTFDRVDLTNGYHPLWQAISVIPYWLGLDDLAAVRALLLVQLALWAATLWLVLGRVGDAVAGWPALADSTPTRRRAADLTLVVVTTLFVANPFLLKMVVNGLESGVEVPVLALLLARALSCRGRFVSTSSRRDRLITGGLLALAFLARTDAVLLFAAIGLWCLLDAGPGSDAVPLATRAVRTVEVLVVPAVVVVAYLALNAAWFHTALQISGTVKRLPLTAPRLVVAGIWVVVAVAALLGCRRAPSKRSKVLRVRRFLRATGWCAAFCILLVGYYGTLQAVPYLWYFCPLALYGMWIVMLFVADLVEGSLAEAPVGKSIALALAPALIVALPLAVGLVWQGRAFLDPGGRALMVHDREAGVWLRRNVPPGERVASWDAGVIGYFSHRSVVNLDGVVNSKAWYDAVRNGTTPAFLRARNVRWVANHGGDVGGNDPDIGKDVDTFFGKGSAAGTRLRRAWIYDYTGTLDGSRSNTATKRMGTFVYQLTRAAPAALER